MSACESFLEEEKNLKETIKKLKLLLESEKMQRNSDTLDLEE